MIKEYLESNETAEKYAERFNYDLKKFRKAVSVHKYAHKAEVL